MLSTTSLAATSSATVPMSVKAAARFAVASLRPSLAQSTSPRAWAPTRAPISPGKRRPIRVTRGSSRTSRAFRFVELNMKRAILIAALVLVSPASARQTGGWPIALVTAEQQNQLLAVDVSAGKVVRRVSLPADPQNVAAGRDTAVVVSTRAGAVTLLRQPSLRVLKIFRGFADPHIVTIRHDVAYVTDDGRGELIAIDLGSRRIRSKVFVGSGAHHMAVSSNGRRLWIALGEHASEIAIVDVSHRFRP